VFVKNLTLSVDERTLAAVRRYASQHDTSLNKLVRDFLERLAKRQDRAGDVRARLRELSDQSPARLGSEDRRRSALHERR
jgi:hypothetical protein